MQSRLLILVAMLAAGSACLTAQERTPADTSAITGFVRYAGGAPIAELRVSLIVMGSARTTRTAIDGSYRFDAISPGEYQLSASLPGVVARLMTIAPGADLKDINFSIPDGRPRRVVTGRVVMNESSRAQPVPARIGVGVRWPDGTLAMPLAPGDQRVVVKLPSGYFLDSVTYGPEMVYSLEGVGGRRLSGAAFTLTVPPEPQTIPALVIMLGHFSK